MDDDGLDLELTDTPVAPAANPAVEELLRRVAEKPHAFRFLRLMRDLEAACPDQPRLGTAPRASQEPVRLGQTPSLTFAPTELHGVVRREAGPPRVFGYFFGLLGPHGPMPVHFTEYVRDRERNAADPTLARFLDVFHHRMLCLFYRSWAQTQPAVHADRPQSDAFAFWLASLVGLGLDGLRDRTALDDHAVLARAGRFAPQCRSAAGLEDALADYFSLRVEVREFVGEWLELPAQSRLHLGRRGGRAGRLGLSTTLGERVWSGQTRFRIVLERLRLAEFRRFLPDGESLPRLVSLVRFYCGDALAFDLQLVLRAEEVPPLQLGQGARLGLTAWLAHEERTEDAGDAVLEPLRPDEDSDPTAAGAA